MVAGFEARTACNGACQPSMPQPYDTLISRYSSQLYSGCQSVQAHYEAHDLAHDPDRLAEYIRLQTMLGNAKLVEIDRLVYNTLPESNPPVPDIDAGEYAVEAVSRASAGMAELTKMLRFLPAVSVLIARDRELHVPADVGKTRDFVYAMEILGRLALKEIDVLGAQAEMETDAQRQIPDSKYNQLLAKGSLLTSRLEMAQAVIGSALTDAEVNATRLPSLGTAIQQTTLVIRRVQRHVVSAAWLASTGLAPERVQIWQNFVPNPSISPRSAWRDAVDACSSAAADWDKARSLARQYDQDQTQFKAHQTLLRTKYLTQLKELTGLDPVGFVDANNVPLGDNLAVAAYVGFVMGQIDQPPLGPGPEDISGPSQASELAKGIQHILQADAAVDTARERIRGAVELMRVEQQRAEAVINIVRSDLNQRVSLERLITYYSSISQSKGTSFSFNGISRRPCTTHDGRCAGGETGQCRTDLYIWGSVAGCTCCQDAVDAYRSGQSFVLDYDSLGYSESKGISWNPNWQQLADARTQLIALEEMQKVKIEAVNSEARVRQLLVDLATAQSEMKQRVLEREGAVLAYRQVLLQLEDLLDNYLAERTDLASAYYANPAYRVERDQAETQAEWSLKRATLMCYRAARRVEYGWADKYSSAGLGTLYANWPNATSVFRANHAEDCRNFLRAVKQWDTNLRSSRSNRSLVSMKVQEVISLRRHVLGLSETYLSGPYEGEELQDPPGSGVVDWLGIQTQLTAFQDYIQSHLLTTELYPGSQFFGTPENPALLITFPISAIRSPTPQTSTPVASQFLPNTWNQRIVGISVNLVGGAGEGPDGLLSGGTLQDVPLGIIQRGAAAIQPAPQTGLPLILMDADPWQDFTFPFSYPNSWFTHAAVNRDLNTAPEFLPPPSDSPLIERPISASEWTLFIPSDVGSGKKLRYRNLTDIEILFAYYHGSPHSTSDDDPAELIGP